jgi:hypothetical protein
MLVRVRCQRTCTEIFSCLQYCGASLFFLSLEPLFNRARYTLHHSALAARSFPPSFYDVPCLCDIICKKELGAAGRFSFLFEKKITATRIAKSKV